MPDDHFSDHSDDGTSEGASHVPGLNQIGARLDDLGKNIQQNQMLGAEGLGVRREAAGDRGGRSWPQG